MARTGSTHIIPYEVFPCNLTAQAFVLSTTNNHLISKCRKKKEEIQNKLLQTLSAVSYRLLLFF